MCSALLKTTSSVTSYCPLGRSLFQIRIEPEFGFDIISQIQSYLGTYFTYFPSS